MVAGGSTSDSDPIVYVDRSDVLEGRLDELKARVRALIAFVDAQQPQMATYGFYLDEEANQMTVVSVHPNSASLERHTEIGAPEFRKLAPSSRFGRSIARAGRTVVYPEFGRAAAMGRRVIDAHRHRVGRQT
jgi:hypothetical protein